MISHLDLPQPVFLQLMVGDEVTRPELNQVCLWSTERCLHCFLCFQDSPDLSATGPAVTAQTEGEQHLLRARTTGGINLDCKSTLLTYHFIHLLVQFTLNSLIERFIE